MAQLRVSPNGPFIRGNSIGDVLLWQGPALGWVPGAVVGGGSAFDFVVEELADLPTPVAGVITLEDGKSYAFKESIDIGTNVIRVESGARVFLKGMGGFNEKVLSGDAASVLDIQGSAYIETLSVDATAGVAFAMSVNASVRSFLCSFSGALEGVTLTGTSGWDDMMSRVSGGTDGFAISGQGCHLIGTRILAGTGRALVGTTTDVLKVVLEGGELVASSGDVVSWNCAFSSVYTSQTVFTCGDPGSACWRHLNGAEYQFIGGRWEGDGSGPGFFFDGDLSGSMQFANVLASNLASMVQRANGVITRVAVTGCSADSSVAAGITWASANIPTNGLSVVGNMFGGAAAFSGFAETDARVNCKGNLGAGGLLAETPIVP